MLNYSFECSMMHFQVDVREDEEQTTKFQEIIDLLVAAGYFRARIKGLSNFDKVCEYYFLFLFLPYI